MGESTEVKELLKWMKKWEYLRYVSAGEEKDLKGVDPACIWTEVSDGLNGSWAYNDFAMSDEVTGYLVVGKARAAGQQGYESVTTEIYTYCEECGGEDDECEECYGDFLVPVDLLDLASEKYPPRTNPPAAPKSTGASAKFCSNCGTPLSLGQKFCSDCGHKL